MTTNVNNIIKGSVNGQGFLQHSAVPVNDATFPIAEGDLAYWDSVAGLAKPLDTDAHAATLLGVALKPSKVNSGIDNTPSGEPDTTIGYGVLAEMFTTPAETYANGAKVYIGANAQTITTVAGANAVGVVRLPSLNGGPVTGAAGIKVQVQVYSRAWIALHD